MNKQAAEKSAGCLLLGVPTLRVASVVEATDDGDGVLQSVENGEQRKRRAKQEQAAHFVLVNRARFGKLRELFNFSVHRIHELAG